MSETYISRSPAIASRLLGNEMIVMSVTDSTFFSLNELASVLWDAADGCTSLSAIVERRICSTFDVDPQIALRDARQFVQDLSAHGILIVSTRPQAAPQPEKVPA